MSDKKYLICPSLVFFFLILFVAAGHSDEAKPAQNQPEVLKERQKFNKLRRGSRNIYKVTMRPGVVFRLQTALGYLSTIDLPEKALKVFAGDQELFKVGVYERQVLIKPITDDPDSRTNLVIITQSARLAFDVSVGAPETADFVLDFRFPEDDEALVQNAFEKALEEKTRELEKTYQVKEGKLDERAKTLAQEKLKEEIKSQVRSIPLKQSRQNGRVQVNLLSLSQVGERAYLRFSVLNYSDTPFRPLKVMIGAVREERKFFKKKEGGVVEFPSELSLPRVIPPDSYEYGLLVFDYRALGKKEKPLFRILEEESSQGSGAGHPHRGDEVQGRKIEITGFEWF